LIGLQISNKETQNNERNKNSEMEVTHGTTHANQNHLTRPRPRAHMGLFIGEIEGPDKATRGALKDRRRWSEGGGEWKSIKILRRNMTYIPKLT
jgi:hypothetical protein